LNGDIFDGWDFKAFKESQKCVIDRVLDLSRKGVNIVLIPGNHDELLRELLPIDEPRENNDKGYKRLDDFQDTRSLTFEFNGNACIEMRRGLVFEAADGRRYAMQHGDQFDNWMRDDKHLIELNIPGFAQTVKIANRRRTAEMASYLYESMVDNAAILIKPQDEHFAAQKWLKNLGKRSSGAVKQLRKGACATVMGAGLDGVICGHIHEPEKRTYYASADGRRLKTGAHKISEPSTELVYLNSGDWKETCSVLTFDQSGSAEVVNWQNVRQEFGFVGKPQLPERNRAVDMRPVTEQICNAIETILQSDEPVQYLRTYAAELAARASGQTGNSTCASLDKPDAKTASVTINNGRDQTGPPVRMHRNDYAGNCIRQGIALNMPV
jgi:UDP-2,3-diacylglucosamine pyrophosphatase LpxH